MKKFNYKCNVGSLFYGLSAFCLLFTGTLHAQMFEASSSTKAENVQVRPVLSSDQKQVSTQKEKEQQIQLSMTNFRISKTLNDTINCYMRFLVKSTMKEPISNISYRLKWPKMETPISFSSIAPNTTVYIDYVLLGDGCYHMDQAPNIIVNRCRIKNMTQQACTDSIRWVK